MRTERDSVGEIEINDDVLWGAQTQRSFNDFKVGTERMPLEIIKVLTRLKRAYAISNNKLEKLPDEKKDLTVGAYDEILSHQHDNEFLLAMWQTGSGTRSNMSVDEVIAHIANRKYGENIIHPDDDVNKPQSSNDTFPSAVHVALKHVADSESIEELEDAEKVLEKSMEENKDITEVGHIHLQDAVPLKLSQEISGWLLMVRKGKQHIIEASKALDELAVGATAVGTGLNAIKGLGQVVVGEINKQTNGEFITVGNKFHTLTSKDVMNLTHGVTTALANNLMRVAGDVRFLASGPRYGIGELSIPTNGPGSSVIPGRVNPTQAEALTVVCVQIMGDDTTIQVAADQGNYELNVYMPMIIYSALQSVRLIRDATKSFTDNCLQGLEANREVIDYYLDNSLMLVTALNTRIGYDKASTIAKYAYKDNTALEQTAFDLEVLTGGEFDEYVNPTKMC